MFADPQRVVLNWSGHGEPPARVRQAMRVLASERSLADQEREGDAHPLAEQLPQIREAVGAFESKLPDMDQRGRVRRLLADYLDQVVLPTTDDDKLHTLPQRLREARSGFTLQMGGGKTRCIWDDKAGLPLLCPDDAREESARLERRVGDHIERLMGLGLQLHYGVLTVQNASPGTLAGRMRKTFRRLARIWKAIEPPENGKRYQRGERQRAQRLFSIQGGIAVMEVPLSAARTWNIHINVFFITRGYFDWKKFQEQWGGWSWFSKLDGTPEGIRAAFRELLKYSARAVPEKSQSHAEAARADQASGEGSATPIDIAPSQIEWEAAEWLEWWQAHQKFRRTRTFGELYGFDADDSEADDVDDSEFETIGTGRWTGWRYRLRVPLLLSSIPGDKSSDISSDAQADWRAKTERIRASLAESVEILGQVIENQRRAAWMAAQDAPTSH